MTTRLLVTGGAGFVGTNLIALLTKVGGWDITVLDNESLGRREHLADIPVRFIRGDILDETVLAQAMEGQDAVVHFAADTRVMDSIADPIHNFRNNVIGTFQVLSQARKAGVGRVINASTGGAILGEAPSPVHEDMVARPLSPYGASKLAAEGYCMAFSGSYGMRTASLRFSNLFGPRSYHKGSVVAAFYKRILAGEELVVYGDGSQIRDYLAVEDLVEGIRRALTAGADGVYQLGAGKPTTLNELLDSMREAIGPGHPFTVRYEPFRAGEIHTTWCDISKARQAFGYAPSIPLIDGLRQTWNWFLDREGNRRS